MFAQIAFPIQWMGAATAERYTRIECVWPPLHIAHALLDAMEMNVRAFEKKKESVKKII